MRVQTSEPSSPPRSPGTDAHRAGCQTLGRARRRRALPSTRAASSAQVSGPSASSTPLCAGSCSTRRVPPPSSRSSRGRSACAAARRPAAPGSAFCIRGSEPARSTGSAAWPAAPQSRRRQAAPPVAPRPPPARPAKPLATSRTPRSRGQALLQRRFVGIVVCCYRDRHGPAAMSVAVGRRANASPQLHPTGKRGSLRRDRVPRDGEPCA